MQSARPNMAHGLQRQECVGKWFNQSSECILLRTRLSRSMTVFTAVMCRVWTGVCVCSQWVCMIRRFFTLREEFGQLRCCGVSIRQHRRWPLRPRIVVGSSSSPVSSCQPKFLSSYPCFSTVPQSAAIIYSQKHYSASEKVHCGYIIIKSDCCKKMVIVMCFYNVKTTRKTCNIIV